MKYKCPKCGNNLDARSKHNKIEFLCLTCGFNKPGLNGYGLEKAYQHITKSDRRSKSKAKATKNRGFPTKKQRRRRKQSLLDQNQENLEEDEIINQNARKIREKVSEIDLSPPLDKVLFHNDLLPVYFKTLEKKEPPIGNNVEDFIPLTGLQNRLKDKGIDRLYQFQEDVYHSIMDKNNVVISAPTGMGKTEAFLLPLIYSIIEKEPNPNRRSGPSAIIIYPTKALAADQLDKIRYYGKSLGISISKYDGDTPQHHRNKIYSDPPDILLTNADMIHYHLMGNLHFQNIVKKVRFVVIDEIHLCVGSFGSNVLWIIRRMRRFTSELQCIGSSATISNAKNFAELIFDDTVELISAGTARKSDINLTMLYPKQRSNLSAMADIATNFVKEEKKTLVFGNGHKSAEVVNMILKEKGIKSDVHRAGLNLSHRSGVEDNFKQGKLDALVSTPTLELGIDIGNLDSVVSMLTGLTSFLQRIGRAGRAGQEAFATLVLRGDDPISSYYAREPEDYLADIEPAFVEPNNPFVSKYQFLAMIIDRPLNEEEAEKYPKLLNTCINEGLIHLKQGKYQPIDPPKIRKMLNDYGIRGIGNSVDIRYFGKKIGDRSLPMALSELHKDAIYLSGGKSYSVIDYNQKLRIAKVASTPSQHLRTQALRNIFPEVKEVIETTTINGLNAAYCELELTETVHGFVKQNIFDNRVIEKRDLDEPIDYTFNTMGFLIALPYPDDLVSSLDDETKKNTLGGTYHAIEHVLIESGNAFSGGGASQIGGISMGDSGMVFVYDGNEGGSGLSNLLYNSLEKGLKRTMKIMEDCPCKRVDGCPRCTYSYQCGNNNQPLHRIGGIETLKRFGKDNTEIKYNFDDLETFVIEPEWNVAWTLGLANINKVNELK